MRVLFVALGWLLATGCATTPETEPAESLFADARFAAPEAPVGADGLFSLSEAMQAFAETQLAERVRARGAQLGLFEAIHAHLRIDYDTATTHTAAETFDARSGNCLSLVILTAAFARHLEVPFQYQSVRTAETWSRVGGFKFLSGHVNLRLGAAEPGPGPWPGRPPGRALIVDFVERPSDANWLRAHAIPEARVVAMYLNNRAAETLAAGDVESAYWWARAAVQADPAFTAAYNTLGVVYRRHGDLPEAERALRHGLAREPANTNFMLNLAATLDAQGRTGEARAVREQAAAIEPYPPFHFFDLGEAAAARGDHAAAIEWFERELERMPYDDELHFAIARAELQLGHLRRARRHAALALEHGTTRDRRSLYAAKLNYLQSLGTN